MTECKFEIGGRYSTRGGETAEIDEIQKLEDGTLRIHAFHRNKKAGASFKLWYSSNGRIRQDGLDHPFDLLLPAIEPEGEPAKEPLSSPTVSALESYMDFWAAFRDAINLGLIDPTDGGYWPEWDQDATIHRAYPTQEAALADCQGIIAAIKRLVEGGPAK